MIKRPIVVSLQAFATIAVGTALSATLPAQQTIPGQAAFAGYTQQKPGVRLKITVSDLPEPHPSESVDNGPVLVKRPDGAWPIAPAGFKVIPGYAQLRGGGHWTRDVAFSADGKHMLVSVGSGSNVDDPDTHPDEFHRADVLEYTPEGKFIEGYAYGRNCVGEAINPATGQLWCSTNERDELEQPCPRLCDLRERRRLLWMALVLHGWPSRFAAEAEHPELKSKVITPDVLVQPHMASLEMTFYPTVKSTFPSQYDGDAFAAEQGSWNRANRGGYEVIRIPMKDGRATGEYEDFLTGFVTPDGKIWNRPVRVAAGRDGDLYVSDDGSRSVWRVSYSSAPNQ